MSIRIVLLVLVALVALVVILFLPGIFDRSEPVPLTGPALDDLEYREIEFESGPLGMAGLLFLPEAPGPYPLAVIIHGSGPSKRDSVWYTSVADHLQRNGIAVLLPDKRGSERSEGDWRTSTLEELAEDTVAAVAYATTLSEVDLSHVGVIGMSQGGWIASVAATRSPDIDYVVSYSGAAVTTDEQLLHEEINNIRQMGTYLFVARLLAPLTTARLQRMAFWQPMAGFDPLPYWRQVEAPVFFAFGEGDPNVPVEESVARLEAMGRDWRIAVYAEGGHAIYDPQTGRVQAAFLDDLVYFIGESVP